MVQKNQKLHHVHARSGDMAASRQSIVHARFASGNVLGRYLPNEKNDSTLHQLDQISIMLRDMFAVDSSHLEHVSIQQGDVAHTQERAVTFTNICGKISHTGFRHCFRSTVLPFLQDIHNGFGSFRGIFGLHCNLILCGSRKCTLFRGATSTCDVETTISHAIHPESIDSVHVHMLCATTRIGKPIFGHKNSMLMHELVHNSNWQGHMLMQTEEKAYMVSFKIDNFDPTFLKSLIGDHQVTNLLLNINLKGSINFFLSVAPTTEFQVGVENAFVPLLQHMRDVVHRAC